MAVSNISRFSSAVEANKSREFTVLPQVNMVSVPGHFMRYIWYLYILNNCSPFSILLCTGPDPRVDNYASWAASYRKLQHYRLDCFTVKRQAGTACSLHAACSVTTITRFSHFINWWRSYWTAAVKTAGASLAWFLSADSWRQRGRVVGEGQNDWWFLITVAGLYVC